MKLAVLLISVLFLAPSVEGARPGGGAGRQLGEKNTSCSKECQIASACCKHGASKTNCKPRRGRKCSEGKQACKKACKKAASCEGLTEKECKNKREDASAPGEGEVAAGRQLGEKNRAAQYSEHSRPEMNAGFELRFDHATLATASPPGRRSSLSPDHRVPGAAHPVMTGLWTPYLPLHHHDCPHSGAREREAPPCPRSKTAPEKHLHRNRVTIRFYRDNKGFFYDID